MLLLEELVVIFGTKKLPPNFKRRTKMTILIHKTEEQVMFENFDTNERLEEVIQWITNDFWNELSNESKVRVIKQLGYMNYPTEDLIKDLKEKEDE